MVEGVRLSTAVDVREAVAHGQPRGIYLILFPRNECTSQAWLENEGHPNRRGGPKFDRSYGAQQIAETNVLVGRRGRA